MTNSKKIAGLGLNKTIRINQSGCLDACEHGVAMVIYPEQIWYGNIKLDDIDEIIESHLVKDIPVDRLIIKSEEFYKNDE